MPILRFDRVDDLTGPEALSAILGRVRGVRRELLSLPSGFSGASHERLHVELADGARETLVLKRARPAANWIAQRTGDRVGREAALLGDPAFHGVWDVLAQTYLAFAVSDGEQGLLMVDLAEWILPDVREPIAPEVEDRLMAALAALHARYWDAPALDHPWLGGVDARSRILQPSIVEDAGYRALVPPALAERVVQGWRLARTRMPAKVRARMEAPIEEHVPGWRNLPRTLIHGDGKVANLAPVPSGRVAAFDWETASAAPATFDITWYLIVNATRLARTRDDVLALYRRHLETGLGRSLTEDAWKAMLDAGIVSAAMMLLWSKALACAEGRAGAEEEWRWWMERLESGG